MYSRIRNLREDSDLNQTAVAKMVGMSKTGYSKYETGENDIPTAILIKLAEYTGLMWIISSGLPITQSIIKKYKTRQIRLLNRTCRVCFILKHL